jgi:hypothetical protein
MKSLGMEAYGVTTTGWSIFYGELKRAALLGVHKELQRKYSARFEQCK